MRASQDVSGSRAALDFVTEAKPTVAHVPAADQVHLSAAVDEGEDDRGAARAGPSEVRHRHFSFWQPPWQYSISRKYRSRSPLRIRAADSTLKYVDNPIRQFSSVRSYTAPQLHV